MADPDLLARTGLVAARLTRADGTGPIAGAVRVAARPAPMADLPTLAELHAAVAAVERGCPVRVLLEALSAVKRARSAATAGEAADRAADAAVTLARALAAGAAAANEAARWAELCAAGARIMEYPEADAVRLCPGTGDRAPCGAVLAPTAALCGVCRRLVA